MRVSEMQRVPVSRVTFERNLNLLVEALKQKRLHFAPHIPVEGLLRVRRLPNGRIDFLSVDESTRLQANMMARMDDEFPGPDVAKQDDAEEEGRE